MVRLGRVCAVHPRLVVKGGKLWLSGRSNFMGRENTDRAGILGRLA